MAEVVIAGAGPVGALLAAELRLHGVDVVVLERRAAPSGQSRANALHARTVATLRRRGLLEPLAGIAGQDPVRSAPRGRAQFAGMAVLDRGVLPPDGPAMLGISQADVETVLIGHAQRLGAQLRRGHNVIGMSTTEYGVTVEVAGPAGGYLLDAAYLVGCDGGRSTVRKLAGIDFPGTPATMTGLLGDVTLVDPGAVPFGWRRTPRGWVVGMIRPTGVGRVIVFEFDGPHPDRDVPLSLAEFSAAVERVLGRPVELTEPRWLSRFGDACRQAPDYLRGRVLLAGDAAHVHFPVGGQGLNLGLQDAVNLGWKLAAAVHGWAGPDLLASYPAERAPVAATVLRNARAQVVLMDPDPRFDPLRELFTELAGLPEVNRHLVGLLGGVDIHYDLAGAADHPLVGRFAPDLTVETATGPRTLVELLVPGRGVFLDLTVEGLPAELSAALACRADRVESVRGRLAEATLAGLLVRPDGYVAWAADRGGENTWSGADDALRRWFGEHNDEESDRKPCVTRSNEPVAQVGGLGA